MPSQKKVLIITYYWPPAGGPGVQRWLKFVKYLRNFQVEPVVYVPENPDYPMLDPSFENEVPKDITVLKKRIFEPYALASAFSDKTKTISSGIISEEKKQSLSEKLMLWIRGNFFIPDARKFWVNPSVEYLLDELQNDDYDAIITTGPPHSLHLIGLQLKAKTGIRWIADFRDPWTTIGYHKDLKLSEKAKNRHLELESEVLNKADEIIVTSFSTQREFERKTEKPVHLITNGFDVESTEETNEYEKFQISHIGSLLSGRNPKKLWVALSELCSEKEGFKEDLVLTLAGKVSQTIIEDIENSGLSGNLNFKGYVSHPEALEIQRESAVLLLIEIDSEDTRAIIPGKLFEYLASRKTIIGIGPEGWDAARIMAETKTGRTFSYSEKSEIKREISRLYDLFRSGSLSNLTANIYKYSRVRLTEKLSEVIHGN